MGRYGGFSMLILMCLLLFGDPTAEPINAQIFIDGQRIDVLDIEVKGSDRTSFQFYSNRHTESVSLYEIARITPTDDNEITIVFVDGQERTGRVRALNFSGIEDTERGERITWLLQNVERIHFVQGRQLKSCPQGHHEDFTTDMFCPVCGSEMMLGHQKEEEDPVSVAPTSQLRLDGRDPSSSAVYR